MHPVHEALGPNQPGDCHATLLQHYTGRITCYLVRIEIDPRVRRRLCDSDKRESIVYNVGETVGREKESEREQARERERERETEIINGPT